ncbi:FkbM family methyltransferase [Geomonas paludis]|uniref:FkbM family methyltransferase n=1 Tax=Geomonas paludis TaxID=2740185 RepID=A0A6V8MWB8_9BACT|nr:FkbM family methyltransferase [Geomonas paludis]UPU34366.1 FkbM family methyltransferase [Geomonas paludis]GFO64351.1 hypothetical protein GMPD_22700 [Geomonas paludis]
MKFLFDALFRHVNHYGAVLPYNLNWQIRLWERAQKFLRDHPLVVCDVGARGSAPDELAPFFSSTLYHAFDADAEECARLNRLPHPYRGFRALPYFIGRCSGTTPFNLFKERGESSCYKPAQRFQDVFRRGDFEVDAAIEMETVSLDEVHAREGMDLPDFLKLDTQGSELEVLQGAQGVIAKACMVEIEVEFLEMYQGQPLFHDVLKFMHDQGFDLLYLNRVMGQRISVFDGVSRGQLIFGDALFGRREDCLAGIATERLAKYVLLLINYGLRDYAYHLMLLHPGLEPLIGAQNFLIAQKNRGRFRRLLSSQLDKLILLLLHLRTYNGLSYDSDRSWPAR